MTAARKQLEEFVDGRTGWKIYDGPNEGRFYGLRTVEVEDVPFHLTLACTEYLRAIWGECMRPWLGNCWSDPGRHVNEEFSGPFDDVRVSLARLERVLDVIVGLRACRTRVAAINLVDPLRPADLTFMCEVLALETIGESRQSILTKVFAEVTKFQFRDMPRPRRVHV